MNLIKKPDHNELKKFGIVLSIFLTIFISIFIYKIDISYYWLIVSFLIFTLSLSIPQTLLPTFYIFQAIGNILGYINSKIILTILFFLVLTPVSLMLRLFSVKFFDTKFDRNMQSYWNKKENTAINFNKQF